MLRRVIQKGSMVPLISRQILIPASIYKRQKDQWVSKKHQMQGARLSSNEADLSPPKQRGQLQQRRS
jgi:hypothetical protein